MASSTTGAFAKQRLRRDWAEVLREPSSLVSAEPLAHNIFEWHANLRPSEGILAGITFHVKITFPVDYPNSPPNLHFPQKHIPSFRHPNLYDWGLCLDILSSYVGFREEYAGWSPAYTVRTLLMQLQSFLFEFDAAPQDHGGVYDQRYSEDRVRRVRREAHSLCCKDCGHCWQNPQPPLLSTMESMKVELSQIEAMKESNKVELSQIQAHEELNRCKKSDDGGDVYQAGHCWWRLPWASENEKAGKGTAYLSAVAPQITIRILDCKADCDPSEDYSGGVFWIARDFVSGSAGQRFADLNDNRELCGCFAWGSYGDALLRREMDSESESDVLLWPKCNAGDVFTVAFSPEDGIVYKKNGEVVHVDVAWRNATQCGRPRQLLRYFLSHPRTGKCYAPPRGGPGRDGKSVQGILALRNASVEVLGEMQLQGPEALQAKQAASQAKQATLQAKQRLEQRREILLRELTELEDKSEHIHASHRDITRSQAVGVAANPRPWASGIPKEVLLLAFMGVNADDVPPLMRVCSQWRELVVNRGLLERLQLCCFYTKASPSEDVLGFGVSATYHDDGNLKALSTELDVLSASAFAEFNIRRGVWGGSFDFFLPLVLDGSHARRAMPILECAIACLASKQRQTLRAEVDCATVHFEPWMALAVLPQLMNSFVVSLMNAKGGVTRHSSEKALLGYCSFHHILLAFAMRHPSIFEVAQQKLSNFVYTPDGRRKSQTPDIGQLLVYRAISGEVMPWEDLARAITEEAGVRSVLWLLRDNPRLEQAACPKPLSSSTQLRPADFVRECFQGRLTGLRLLMFQAFFLRNIANPEGQGPEETLTRYGLQYGLPSVAQKEALFKAAHEILAVSTWPEYYARLGLPCQAGALELRKTFVESAECGYHNPSPYFAGFYNLAQDIQRKGAQQKDKENQKNKGNQGESQRRARDRVGVKKDLQEAFKSRKENSLGAAAPVANATQAPSLPDAEDRSDGESDHPKDTADASAVMRNDTDDKCEASDRTEQVPCRHARLRIADVETAEMMIRTFGRYPNTLLRGAEAVIDKVYSRTVHWHKVRNDATMAQIRRAANLQLDMIGRSGTLEWVDVYGSFYVRKEKDGRVASSSNQDGSRENPRESSAKRLPLVPRAKAKTSNMFAALGVDADIESDSKAETKEEDNRVNDSSEQSGSTKNPMGPRPKRLPLAPLAKAKTSNMFAAFGEDADIESESDAESE